MNERLPGTQAILRSVPTYMTLGQIAENQPVPVEVKNTQIPLWILWGGAIASITGLVLTLLWKKR